MRSPVVRNIARILAVILSFSAMVVSYKLTLKHLEAAPTTQPSATQPADQPATRPAAGHEELGFLDQACTSLFENTSCEEVIHSRYASVTFGGQTIPVALLGLYYFTCLFWWFLLAGDVSAARAWVHILVACVMTVGLGTSAFYIYQLSQMTNWCPLCAFTHAVNLLLFLCMFLLWPRSVPAQPGPVVVAPGAEADRLFPRTTSDAGPQGGRSPSPSTWMLVATPIAALLTIYLEGRVLLTRPDVVTIGNEQCQTKLKQAEQVKDHYEKLYKRYDNQWQHTLLAWNLSPVLQIPTEGDPVRGPATAPHTMVIFSDFQCPTCARFESTVSERIMPLAARTGGLRIIFKHWPISTSCNKYANFDLHPLACQASVAAEAAFIVGGNDGFWKMHDLLFANQAEWKKTRDFEKYAQLAGLNLERFRQAMADPGTLARVQADIAEGVALGEDLVKQEKLTEDDRAFLKVDSTPSVYIDGKRLYTMHHFKTWQWILASPAPGQAAPPAQGPSAPPATQPAGPRVQPQQ